MMRKYYLLWAVFFFGLYNVSAQPRIIPDSIAAHVEFIQNQKLSAKEYILNLFNKYDIVIFCERTHDELTQYELLVDLFSDNRFQEQVGDIFMEMGGSHYDKQINDYLLAENLSQEQSIQKALEIQRNAMWYPLWERYNYHYLLTSLYDINRSLSIDKKIKLHPTDIAVDWEEIVTAADIQTKIYNYDVQSGRDSVMGNTIVSYIARNDASSAGRKKYFLILNSAHATKGVWSFGRFRAKSAATYVFERFGERVANVLVNFENTAGMYNTVIGLPEVLPILNGKLDAAFELLGTDDRGFDIIGSPLEGKRFENMAMEDSTLTNEQVFTGFVFYKSFPKHEHVNGVPDIVDAAFKPELKRRFQLWGAITGSFLLDKELENANFIVKKNPEGLTTYWQRVMYWIGGGKQIYSFYRTAKSLDETISFIRQEIAKGSNSDYDVSETGINTFGYTLLNQGKLDAATTVLKLNVELHPNSWNTHDSYGEALLKTDRKKEAVEAYKKSLELNPDNENAKKVLQEFE